MASQNGHVEVVKLLMEYKVNGDLAENDGYTSLHIASEDGHVEVVKLLLDYKVSYDLRTMVTEFITD